MLEVKNQTPYAAQGSILLDGNGSQQWVVVVKATYRVNAKCIAEPHPEQEPVSVAPVYSGEPGKSSLLRESEMVVEHPGTDVTLNATAWAPNGRPVEFLDVGARVGDLVRVLRVFGNRRWLALGLAKSAPEPFTRMPITWERAYGGTEVIDPGSGKFACEARNPVGAGFATRARSLKDKPLPNVEDPHAPIWTGRSRPKPAGFGAIASHWSPRNKYGGTYDEKWKRTRMPLWPADYDPRFHQSAPPGFVADKPLVGGETVAMKNLTPEGDLWFRLPREYVIVETTLGGSRVRQRVQLDRVILEPDERKVVMVWRSALDCGGRARQVDKTVVRTKPWVKK